MSKHETVIITNASQVPDGYVPMKSPVFTDAFPAVSPRTIWKALSDAHHEGWVRAAKLVRCLGDLKTGRVFVHEDDAAGYLNSRYAARSQLPEEPKPQPKPSAAVIEVPFGGTTHVAELLDAVQRLTAAVGDLTAAMQLRAEAEAPKEFVDGMA